MKKKLKKLYDELLELVLTEHFNKYGFAKAGNYNSWIEDVRKMKKEATTFKTKELAGNILILSVHYTLGNDEKIIADLRLEIEKEF